MNHRKAIGGMLSVLVMGGALLVSGALLSQTSLAQGKKETLEGVVSDTMCGAKHAKPDGKACTIGCVSKGKGYALVVGEKVYTLKGKTEGIEKLANEKAKVTGTVNGMDIDVSSIEAAS